MGRGELRGRDDDLIVWCDEATPYELPADEGQTAPLPVTGPKMEEWADDADTPPAVGGATPIGSAPHTEAPAEPRANGNGHGAAQTPDAPAPPTAREAQRRKLLINLTETDSPEEDAHLLRSVLQVLLDYPGTDGVDLLISSEGKRWRLEMPIITTEYCDDLAARLTEMLGRSDGITLESAGALV